MRRLHEVEFTEIFRIPGKGEHVAEGQLPLGAEPKSSKDFEMKCPDGTPLNEAVSILQKEIRRGKELEALYWARQIEAYFPKYVWRRLVIISAEDIGLGNPQAVVVVEALWSAYEVIRKESRKDKPDGNLIAMAVLLLCRSEKNREADHLKNVEHSLEKHGWKPEIPEYAIDSHTKRGREIYRTKEDRDRGWFLEWSKVDPEVGPYDARLWHWRRLAGEGTLDTEEVEKQALAWAEAGDLLYGIEGRYPPPYRGQGG